MAKTPKMSYLTEYIYIALSNLFFLYFKSGFTVFLKTLNSIDASAFHL